MNGSELLTKAQFRFPHHEVEWFQDQRLCVTRFADGSEAHACPHDTDEYRQHAANSGIPNFTYSSESMADLYCLHHDLVHCIFGEMQGGRSHVLDVVAFSRKFCETNPCPKCDDEEAIVKMLHRYFNLYGWPVEFWEAMACRGL